MLNRPLTTLSLSLSLLLSACTTDKTTLPAQDTTLPTVQLNTPVTPITQAGPQTITATAQDDVAVKEVLFYLDGQTQPLDTDANAPYQTIITWNATRNGPHQIRAVAVDTSGNRSLAATSNILVNIPTLDTTPPTLTLNGPIAPVTTASTAQYRLNATDNIGVVKVEFYDNGTLLSTQQGQPFILNRAYTAVDNGQHVIRAVAFDAASNRSETSVTTTVNIPVNATPGSDTIPPNVNISVPTTQITTAGAYTITVTTSDNTGVVKLDAVVTTPLGELPLNLNASGGSQTIQVSKLYNGQFTLRATAYDAAGNSSTESVTVNVNIP